MRSILVGVGVLLVLRVSASVVVADAPASVADLVKAKAAAAANGFDLVHRQFEAGAASSEAVCTWSRRWFDAQRDGARGKALATAADDYLARDVAFEAEVDKQFNAGARNAVDKAEAAWCRADAELEAARAHGRR